MEGYEFCMDRHASAIAVKLPQPNDSLYNIAGYQAASAASNAI